MDLNNLLRKKKRDSPAFSQFKLWEMQSIIQKCCEGRVEARIKIDGDDNEFICIFTGAGEECKWINMRGAVPLPGDRSKSLTVSFSLNGIQHYFNTIYLSGKGDKYGGIRIAYPEQIENKQQREHFRVEPAIEESIMISALLEKDKGLKMSGLMRDISEGGLSFYIDAETAAGLSNEEPLSSVSFSLSETSSIETEAIIRSIFPSKKGDLICGIEFIRMGRESLSKIYSYVVKRQQDILKRRAKTE